MVDVIFPVCRKVPTDLLVQVLEFVFDQESYIRDETLPEKILRAFQLLDDIRLKELLSPLEANLQLCFKNFALYSQAIQSLALRLVSIVLKISNSILPFLCVLQYDNLSTASRSAYVNVCASSVTFLPHYDLSWVPIRSLIGNVLTANVYLRREIGEFFWVAQKHNNVLFSLLLEDCEKENIFFWNKLLCCSSLDLTEASLQQVVIKQLKAADEVDPALIVKHPELLPVILLDHVSCSCGSPAYFEVLSMYGSHFQGSRDSDILAKFLLYLNLPPDYGELTLKSQFVDPFCSFINSSEKNSTTESLIQPLFNCLIEIKVEPLNLRLRMLRCLSQKFCREVSNAVLLDMFEVAMTENDAKSLQFIMDFFFQQNAQCLDEMWTRVYEVSPSKNPFSLTNKLVSMKVYFDQAVGSIHWDVRDAICSSIGSILDEQHFLTQPGSRIFKDAEEMVYKLMNDPNHYVLCSVLKILPMFYRDGSSILDYSKMVTFFEHCFTFCEDSIHAELMNVIELSPRFGQVPIDESLLRKTFESDLCSYKTKGKAANLVVENRRKTLGRNDQISFPEWLNNFLHDEFSDQQLVEEVHIALGLKPRPFLSDEEYAELQLMAVCEDIMAESITSSVPLDCY